MTLKLYWEDPYLTSFETTVTGSGRDPRGLWVELAATAFYPECGGQPADRGRLTGVEVTHVEEVDGRIRHYIAAEAAPAGTVAGEIDGARRLDHMQQHTGQHMLSAVFVAESGLETVSFHLGAEECTIDLAAPAAAPGLLARVEEQVNRDVLANLPVDCTLHEPDDLARLGLRRPAQAEGEVRVVCIGGLDRSACGGTHVTRSGEVGPVLITATEKIRGLTRVHFVCGLRALARARRDVGLLAGLAQSLSCAPADVPAIVAGLQGEAKTLRKGLAAAEADRDRLRAAHALAGRPRDERGRALLVEHWPAGDARQARAYVQELVRLEPLAAAAVAVAGESAALVLARGDGLDIDLRPLLAELLAGTPGRGGGGPALVQAGGLPAGGLAELLARVETRLRTALEQAS